jgi:hypothetical protein
MPNRLVLAIAVLGVALASVQPSRAIPAFARQYHISCATCHAAPPKLNAFGQQFMDKGYLFEGLQQRAYIPDTVTGDEALNLFDRVPLGFRFQQWADLRVQNRRWRQDFKAPWAAKFLTGGALGSIANFYAYVIFEKGEPPFFEDAWVHLHPWENFGLQLGQFQISDLMFPRELRLTRADYSIYKIGRFPLTYQRGIVLSAFDIALGVVNGNGIGEYIAGDADADNRKVFFGHIALPLDLGLFALYGEVPDTAGALIRGYRVGVDWRTWLNERLQLFTQALYGYDRSRSEWLAGGFLGLDYVDFPHVVAVLLSSVEAPEQTYYRQFRTHSVALQYSYYPYRNLRLLAELERELVLPMTRLTIGVDFAY